MKVRIRAFGCKVSQYEAQVLLEKHRAAGWQAAAEGEPADRVVVCGCVVTARAEAEGTRFARRAAGACPEVIASGCLARRPAGAPVPPGVRVAGYRQLLAGFADPREGVTGLAGRARAYLKIQDGCDRGCAYCLVCRIRGPVTSRPAVEVENEARALAEKGYREAVLTGINLGLYGRETGGCLADLVSRLLALPGLPADFRFRFSSLEPDLLSDDLLRLAADSGRITRHLHLPMQSGSDRILAAMGRRYRLNDYLDTVARVRHAWPGAFLSTDIMVGFPGEAESDFEATRAAAGKIEFNRVHVFRFSPRPGTPAAAMPGQVPEAVKRARALGLRAVARAQAVPGGPVGKLRLVLASGNCRKSAEIREILGDLPGVELLDLNDFPALPEPAETGATFAENAGIKAEYYADRLKQAVLAEDSGLTVTALDGRPGVYSARFAGPGKDDRANITRLLGMMSGLTGTGREAFFTTVACLLRPGEKPRFFTGRCAGRITRRPRGGNGFGYDPVFRPADRDRTFAEMSAEEKNRLSHRRLALEQVRAFLAAPDRG